MAETSEPWGAPPLPGRIRPLPDDVMFSEKIGSIPAPRGSGTPSDTIEPLRDDIFVSGRRSGRAKRTGSG